VDGRRVTETPVAPATPTAIEFGPGGPRVRLFIGDDAAIEALPPAQIEARRPSWLIPAIAATLLAVLVIALVATC
jgi:hypothetical protein